MRPDADAVAVILLLRLGTAPTMAAEAAAYLATWGKDGAGSWSINSCGGKGDVPPPPRLDPRVCKVEGVCDRGKPKLGIGGVLRSDIREEGRRTRDGTGIDEPMVRLPSILARGPCGVDVGRWILFLSTIVVAMEDPNAPPPPAIRELGRGIALSSFGPTTLDKSLAELIRVSSAFIFEIISAIIRLDPAAPLLAAGRGVEGPAPAIRVAARTEARRCALALGEDVSPCVEECEACDGVPIRVSLRERVLVRVVMDSVVVVGLSSCTAASDDGSAARTSLLNLRL